MNENTERIISLYDGQRTSVDVAKVVGLSPRYIRKVAKKLGLDRLGPGARIGKNNHQFVSGRRIDLDGYALVTAPIDHPYARQRTYRKGKLIFEHRLVMEKKLGRYLLPSEVCDHKDGLTLHNDPSNLRLFEKNGDHLRATITGLPKQISVSGRQNIKTRLDQPEDWIPVDTYYLRRERGDCRMLQILQAVLIFGIDNPFLLGTHYHLRKAQIDWSSRSNLEHALGDLYQRFAEDLFL